MEQRFNKAGKPFHFTEASASREEILSLLRQGLARHTGWTMRGKPAYMLTGAPLESVLPKDSK